MLRLGLCHEPAVDWLSQLDVDDITSSNGT